MMIQDEDNQARRRMWRQPPDPLQMNRHKCIAKTDDTRTIEVKSVFSLGHVRVDLHGDPHTTSEWPNRIRIGINGFNEQACLLLRCALEDCRGFEIVAINEPELTPEQIIYSIQYNTVYGKFKGHVGRQVVSVTPSPSNQTEGAYCALQLAGRLVALFACKRPLDIPWQWLNVDYVVEMTGTMKKLEQVLDHLRGGRARKVLVVDDVTDIPLLMFPITSRVYQRGTSVVATGSANAHAMTTLLALLGAVVDLTECMLTLLLGTTSKQRLVDSVTQDPMEWRLGRAAGLSMLPVRCRNELQSVLFALPHLADKLAASCFHVPVASNHGLIDLTFRVDSELPDDFLDQLLHSPLLKQFNASMQLANLPMPISEAGFCRSLTTLTSSLPPTATSALTSQTANKTTLVGKKIASRSRSHSSSSSSSSSSPRSTSASESASTSKSPDKQRSLQRGKRGLLSQGPFGQSAKHVGPVARSLGKDEVLVSSDVDRKQSLCLIATDYSMQVSQTMAKLVAFYDPGISFCRRILDTLAYMRTVDHP